MSTDKLGVNIDNPTSAAEYNALSGAEKARVYKYAEETDPVLWKKCYPRVYTVPKCGEYPSPKAAAICLWGAAAKYEIGAVKETEQYEFHWASHLARYKVPTYWISHDLAVAMRKTTPPHLIDWYNMPMPFPAAVFMLPKGIITHQDPHEGEVQFVSYARYKVGDVLESPLLPVRYGSINGGMVVFVSTRTHCLMHWNLPYDIYPKINPAELGMMSEDAHSDHKHDTAWPMFSGVMTKQDNQCLAESAHLIFNVLLMMMARPHLVTPARLEKRVPGKNGQAPREFWTPHVVGENYKLRRESRDLGGTHASPRGHWVSGSWILYHVGPGRKEDLYKLVDPYWRGGDDE